MNQTGGRQVVIFWRCLCFLTKRVGQSENISSAFNNNGTDKIDNIRSRVDPMLQLRGEDGTQYPAKTL